VARAMFRSTMRLVVLGVWTALPFGLVGCFYDYGALSGSKADTGLGAGSGGHTGESGGAPGTGGGPASTGGRTASGGVGPGKGGAGTGGAATGTGGVSTRIDTGGQTATGGAGTGGRGGAGTGTGGAGTGTGGAGTGGRGGAGAGTGGAGGAGGGTVGQSEPVLWYRFDEESGDAQDSGSGPGTPRPGVLMTFGTGGAVAFSTTKVVGTRAITFAGNQATGGGYVVVPPIVDLAPGAVTLSLWVYPTVDRDWVRIFDFGSSQNVYMFLTSSEGQDANNYVRFAITTMGTTAEQRITTNRALALNQWQHVTVVLNAGSPYTGSIYINGTLAGSNTAMSLHAANLGATTGNYLGRSTFPADWYYSGSMDDFRIYNRALSAAEVTALFNQR
jgi:hypothetical protein